MKLATTTKIVIFVSLWMGISGTSPAFAKQFTHQIHGKEVVVHTSAIPVILHRMVPPQHGRHVTQREMESGKIPQPTKVAPLPRRR